MNKISMKDWSDAWNTGYQDWLDHKAPANINSFSGLALRAYQEGYCSNSGIIPE